jgi:hypothetical protein
VSKMPYTNETYPTDPVGSGNPYFGSGFTNFDRYLQQQNVDWGREQTENAPATNQWSQPNTFDNWMINVGNDNFQPPTEETDNSLQMGPINLNLPWDFGKLKEISVPSVNDSDPIGKKVAKMGEQYQTPYGSPLFMPSDNPPGTVSVDPNAPKTKPKDTEDSFPALGSFLGKVW